MTGRLTQPRPSSPAPPHWEDVGEWLESVRDPGKHSQPPPGGDLTPPSSVSDNYTVPSIETSYVRDNEIMKYNHILTSLQNNISSIKPFQTANDLGIIGTWSGETEY